jgi:multicomponent Na+:H+ antiporter subunit E
MNKMKAFLWNILLALAWLALTGQFDPGNFIAGFLVGLLVLHLARRFVGTPDYIEEVRCVLSLAIFFIWELILANLRIAWDVVTPRHHMRPGVIAVPLDARTDAEITMLANMVSLTPGTLTLDVSADRKVLYIHAMYVDDPQDIIRGVKDGFERRILEIVR